MVTLVYETRISAKQPGRPVSEKGVMELGDANAAMAAAANQAHHRRSHPHDAALAEDYPSAAPP
jgi:hypothetical protein